MDEPSASEKVVNGIKDVADIVGDVHARIKGGSDIEGRIQQLFELTQKILANSLTMIQLESSLRDKARMLEARLEEVENWERKKELYELKNISPHDAFVYMLKTPSGTPDSRHKLCTTCFEKRKKRILQPEPARLKVLHCSECGLTIPLI